MINIFVYGTLKPHERNYPLYCAGQVLKTKRGIARGKLYHLCLGYPGMILGEGRVQGYVLTFADPQILERLDQLENYNPNRPADQNTYQRQLISLETPSGASLGQGWVYTMTEAKVQQFQGIWIPSGWWEGMDN